MQLLDVELIAQADVENAGDDSVNPILGMAVGHQLHPTGQEDPNCIRSRLEGLADKNREARRRGEGREWLPIDLFRQYRFECDPI